MTRWSDNDHVWGPFLYAYSRKYRPAAVILESLDDEEWSDGNRASKLRFSALGHTLIITLPEIVGPHLERVYPGAAWDAATVARLGRDWYWNVDRRAFGFSCSDGFLQIFRGRMTGDSLTDRTKGWFLPWTQWRHVRHSLYDPDGNKTWDEPERRTPALGGALDWFEELRKAEEATPAQRFRFRDFDGEEIVATCRMEEREWRFGTGHFKWLSWFRRPKIERYIKIDFSSEVGRQKGSWKGGTVGHSAKMDPRTDTICTTFMRYCREAGLEWLGFYAEPDTADIPETKEAWFAKAHLRQPDLSNEANQSHSVSTDQQLRGSSGGHGLEDERAEDAPGELPEDDMQRNGATVSGALGRSDPQ